MNNNKKGAGISLIDLFAGVGGMSLGFQQAGFVPSVAIEHKKSIAEGHKKNFSQVKHITQDIVDVDLHRLLGRYVNYPTVVVGGPPCQGFSQKGQRRGLSDERNFLFRKFIDSVRVAKPIAFVIENVPGLLSNEKGYFLNEILTTFALEGYQMKFKVLNALDFGVPQNRKRAFIVGTREGIDFYWPEPVGFYSTVYDAISDLPKLKSGEGNEVSMYTSKPLTKYQSELRKNSDRLYNHVATKHSDLVLERLKMIPEGGSRADLPEEHHTKSIYSGTWSRLVDDKPARTITTRFDTPSSGMFTLPNQDRCLTVREAARIQSFPDDFIFTGNKSNQMVQVGNAVPPLMAQAVARSLLAALTGSESLSSHLPQEADQICVV